MADEHVTMAAGVPTIWNGIIQMIEKNPDTFDLSDLRVGHVGGAAAPESLLRAADRVGIRLVQLWGMTETSPIGSSAALTSDLLKRDADAQYRHRAKQGRPVALLETRVRSAGGIAPWDDETMGELEVRGPWVAGEYYNAPESHDRFTEDGWFRTGDIVTIDRDGWITIRDRAKDVIKSGGEWISSVALENMLMAHPSVAEAMVIGLPHPQWDERPLALVVRRDGCDCSADDLTAHLAPHFAKWWLPTSFEFVASLPRTSVGKFDKKVARREYAGYFATLEPILPSTDARKSSTAAL
jgi:fatty-acyl-CoA synthase